MIAIEQRCDHCDARSVVMLVIAGLLRSRTWVECPECGAVGLSVDDCHDHQKLEIVEGGATRGLVANEGSGKR